MPFASTRFSVTVVSAPALTAQNSMQSARMLVFIKSPFVNKLSRFRLLSQRRNAGMQSVYPLFFSLQVCLTAAEPSFLALFLEAGFQIIPQGRTAGLDCRTD